MSRHWPLAMLLGSLFGLVACATIHPYFPVAESEFIAERVIDNTLVLRSSATTVPSRTIDAGSAESLRLQEAMQTRVEQLRPYYDSGGAGFGEDGYLAVPDPGAVPPAERNRLNTLIANENADRAALYREIAVASHEPRWEGEIRNSFARRWTLRAQQSGWFHQSGGVWMR